MRQKKWAFPLFIVSLLISTFFIQCSSTKSTTGNSLEKESVEAMIKNHSFIFVAERVDPLRGRSRILTSSYDVRVNNDSLVSYLPYFGRAYSAPLDPTNTGIQFTSTNFSYDVTSSKGTQWRISIVPKDVPSVQEFVFTIFENGSTSLSVISTSRDQISFSGNVKKVD